MHRFGYCLKGERTVFDIFVFINNEIFRVLGETEETEPLRQLHNGARLGLFRCAPLSHLFLSPDHLFGIAAAYAKENGYIKPPIVDADSLFKDIQVHFPELILKPPDSFFG